MSDIAKQAVVSQTDNVAKPRRRSCLGHCARFWWAYLILLVIAVVVVVPVVILVVIPRIVQQKLDDAELIIDGIVVSHTQAQNMTMAINSTIKSDGSVHATIDGFPGVMYLEDYQPHTPFAKINFPPTTSAALQIVNTSQFLPIDDLAALTRFNTWLFVNDSLRVTVEGDTHVHVRGISRSYPATFKKTITMPGLGLLKGTVVNDTKTTLQPDAQGNNLRGTTYIPNRSLVTFELGNCTFDIDLLGENIGTVYIDNLVVSRGTTVAPMRATIQQQPVLNALVQKPYCDQAKGILPTKIRGKSVVNHGQPLSYFADALASVEQSVPIDTGIHLPCNNSTSSA